jgi:hypothetical protein
MLRLVDNVMVPGAGNTGDDEDGAAGIAAYLAGFTCLTRLDLHYGAMSERESLRVFAEGLPPLSHLRRLQGGKASDASMALLAQKVREGCLPQVQVINFDLTTEQTAVANWLSGRQVFYTPIQLYHNRIELAAWY